MIFYIILLFLYNLIKPGLLTFEQYPSYPFIKLINKMAKIILK